MQERREATGRQAVADDLRHVNVAELGTLYRGQWGAHLLILVPLSSPQPRRGQAAILAEVAASKQIEP
jgi:hypothetical protein